MPRILVLAKRILIPVVATLCVSLAVPASGATTHSSWVVSPTDQFGAASTSAFVNAVSCVGPTFCAQGGSYEDSTNGYQATVSVWNGVKWTDTVVAKSLNTGNYAEVKTISCTSSTFCVAGGFYWTGDNQYQAFVALYDGAKWTVQELATTYNLGNDGEVLSVSCTSSTFCVAAGYYSPSAMNYQAFASVWNGQNWSDQALAVGLNTGNDAAINSVSCTSKTFCVAGGYYYTGGFEPLVEQWDGAGWTASTIAADLNTGNDGYVTKVACSGTFCAAAGLYKGSTNYGPFLAVLKGGSWLDEKALSLVASINWTFEGLSCPSASACVVVGDYTDPSSATHLFASVWNGVGWSDSVRAAALDTPKGESYYGLSCGSTTYCVAVGYYYAGQLFHPLVSTWNGSAWTDSEISTPSPVVAKFRADLYGVSCAKTFCAAGGYYQAGETDTALALESVIAQAALHVVGATGTQRVGHAWALRVRGGSGTGAVTWRVRGAHCTVKARTLHASAPTTCAVTATKAASGIYAATTSPSVRVTFKK